MCPEELPAFPSHWEAVAKAHTTARGDAGPAGTLFPLVDPTTNPAVPTPGLYFQPRPFSWASGPVFKVPQM